jgi:hypothetical protein
MVEEARVLAWVRCAEFHDDRCPLADLALE